MRTAVRSAGLRLLSEKVLARLLGIGMGAAALASCGGDPDTYALVVNVDNVPQDAAKLVVSSQLDARPATTAPLQVTTKLTRFGVRLPRATSGTLTLSIDVLDGGGCKLGSSAVTTTLAGNYRDELRATVSLLATKQCDTPLPPPGCSPGILCWSSPRPQGNPIKSLWAVAPSDVWAVGDVGLMLHYDGTQWKKVDLGITETLGSIWGSSAADLWAVGEKGKILHYDGKAWTPDVSGTTRELSAVFGTSADDVWAVGASGTAVRRLKGSVGWVPNLTGVTSWLYGVWGRAANEVYAVGEAGTILKFDGATWTQMTNPGTQHLLSVWGSGAKTYAVGFAGTILDLNGTTWSQVNSGTTNALLGVFSPSAGKFVVAGEGGTILRSSGAAFVRDSNVGSVANLFTARGTGDSDLWAGGSGGKLLRYDGTNWTSSTMGAERPLRGVHAISPSDVWAVGEAGTVMHYDGTGWSSMTVSTPNHLNAVWATSPTEVTAVGDGGVVFRYNGNRWTQDSSTPGQWKDARGVWADGPGNVWVVATSASATQMLPLFSHYDGSFWNETVALSNAPNSVNGVWGIGGSSLIYMVGGNYMAIVNTMSKSGTVYTTSTEMLGVHGTGSSNVWAVGQGGIVFRWEGSAPWVQHAMLMTPNALYGVYAPNKDTAWVVGDLGTVLRYNGSTWSLPESGTRNNLRAVRGLSDTDFWVAGAAGSLLHSMP